MTFIFPDPLPDKPSVQGKSTIKIYKSKLNKIGKLGYNTPELLIDNSTEVIDHIKNGYTDNYQRRVVLCAIFWILHGTDYVTTTNPYHAYYQEVLPDWDAVAICKAAKDILNK